jgi:ribonucleoside-diphosphate reductase alpha chain
MLYKDAANFKSNQKNLGTIKSSNLCVSGDTLIVTSRGIFEIGALAKQRVDVWNGTKWSNVEIVQTGVRDKLIRVVLSDGYDLICTLEHKFVLEDGSRVDAKSLVAGQRLVRTSLPLIEGSSVFDVENAELRGFYKTMDDCLDLTRASVKCRIDWINGFLT